MVEVFYRFKSQLFCYVAGRCVWLSQPCRFSSPAFSERTFEYLAFLGFFVTSSHNEIF